MMRIMTTLMAAGALMVGVAAAHAQWTYVDAVANQHPDYPEGANIHVLSPDGSTNLNEGPPVSRWGYRPYEPDKLPGGPGNFAALTNCYGQQIGAPEDEYPFRPDLPSMALHGQLWTVLDGLIPGETYALKLYGVWNTQTNGWGVIWGLCSSLEYKGNPTNSFFENLTNSVWSEPITQVTINEAGKLGMGQGWVDMEGNPVEVDFGTTPDTRGNIFIGTATADTNGTIAVGVRRATGYARAYYDGLAYMRVADPPVIVEASASPSVLWPPNNRMVTVNVSALVEDNSGEADWKVFGIQCDQPHQANELEFVDDHTVALCAKRSGEGGDRTYTLWLRATDALGDECQPVCVQVTVPHDRGEEER